MEPTTRLDDLLAAVRAADPDRRHLTPFVATTNNGSRTAPTVAVDPVALPRLAYFPLSGPTRRDGTRSAAPDVEPLVLTGATLTGRGHLRGVPAQRPGEEADGRAEISLRIFTSERRSVTEELSTIPVGDASAPFSVALPCSDGCTVTGVAVQAPVGGKTDGTVVLRDLAVDGQPFSLGSPDGLAGGARPRRGGDARRRPGRATSPSPCRRRPPRPR